MKKIKVKLESVNNVALFVKICGSEYYKNIDIDYAIGRYILDAKSLMGILSADLSNIATVTINTDNEDIINKFKTEISLWTVNEEE